MMAQFGNPHQIGNIRQQVKNKKVKNGYPIQGNHNRDYETRR